MNNSNTTITSFEYLKGRQATDKLKQLLDINKDSELARVLGVPKGTLATWHQRNITPYELILRVALAKGANIHALALGVGELFIENNSHENLIKVPTKCINAGKITELSAAALDLALIPEQFANENLVLFVTDHSRYLVDCSRNDIIQGRYIIEIDGKYSLNGLQRLPENKIAIIVMDVPIVVDREKINIIGRVITSINQEY